MEKHLKELRQFLLPSLSPPTWIPRNTMLSEEAKASLNSAGWFEGRRVSKSLVLDSYEKHGYAVSEALIDFVRTFDELTLAFFRHGELDRCWFDASRVLEVSSKPWADRYSAVATENMVPVGEMYFDHFLVLVGDSGAIYAGYDNYLYRVGVDWESAFSNLVAAEGFERLD